MKFIKADGVPILITIFGILLGVGGTIIGITAMLDPTTAVDFVDGADKMGIAWGGRNAGLGVVMVAAVLLRNVAAYAAAFAGAMLREFSDVVAGLTDGGSFNTVFAVVLLLELVCLVILVRNTVTMRNERAQG